ncbi:hypothetical protein DUNSADRAFT_14107 [Dunaliella salina]|uniref:Glycosyltransferase n=1 Tax=Dunaliella salina TaxID=3046 RepID=A0ABQ7G7Z1_DUNSA|nr:hypothetical protein DUNSADRAFT_14107 [Dunaliella salina]KAF5830726.1 hypothetical protein DUNSADRAFT_14107 [Dunaliella salina]|eukprot:KAF5830725.1 hypothetical protein DUNSADRAFT_14107 [Dunaliella salina]
MSALLRLLGLCCITTVLAVADTEQAAQNASQIVEYIKGAVSKKCTLHFVYIEYTSSRQIKNHLTLLKLSIESVAFTHTTACVDVVTDDAELVPQIQGLDSKIPLTIHLVPYAICLPTHNQKWMARLQCLEARALTRFLHKDVVIIDSDVVLRDEVASVFAEHDFDVALTVTHEGRTLYSMHINVGIKFFKNVAQHTIDLWFLLAKEYLAVRARPTPPTWWLVLFYGTGAENQRIIESWTHLVEPYTSKYYEGVKFFSLPCTVFNYARWWLRNECQSLAWSPENAGVKAFHFNGKSNLKQQPLLCYMSLMSTPDGLGLSWDSQLVLATAESKRLVFFTIAGAESTNKGTKQAIALDLSLHSLLQAGASAGSIFVASVHAVVLAHCRARWGVNVLDLPAEGTAPCLEVGVFQLLARLSLDVLYFKPGARFHGNPAHEVRGTDLLLSTERPLDLFYMSGKPSTYAFMSQLRALCASHKGAPVGGAVASHKGDPVGGAAVRQLLHSMRTQHNMSAGFAKRTTFCMHTPGGGKCQRMHASVSLPAL